MGKKKAADFYFTKKSNDQKPAPAKDDFMSKAIIPPQTPPSARESKPSPSKVSPAR